MPHHVDFADSPLFGHIPPARPATTPPPGEPYADGFHAYYPSPSPFPYQPRGSVYPQQQLRHHRHLTDPPPRAPAPPSTHPAARPFLRSHTAAAAGLPIPPELADLPWGAQMYIKRVRALQEEEERERAALARKMSFADPMTATTPGLSSPRKQQQQHYQKHATWASATTMDPDHGGGGVGLGFGTSRRFSPTAAPARPPTPAAPAPTPVIPSRENVWRGAQPW